MRLLDEREGPRGLTPQGFELPAAPERPSLGETVRAAFGLHNDVINFFRWFAEPDVQRHLRDDDDPDAWMTTLNFRDSKYETLHLDRFLNVRSVSQAQAVMNRIEREERYRDILARGGAGGLFSTIAAGVLSPTSLIPVVGWYGAIAKVGRAGRAAAWAVSGAVGGATAIGLQELVLQGTQETRTATETIFNIAGGAIITGILGGAIGALTWQQIAALGRGVSQIPGTLREQTEAFDTLIGQPAGVGAAAAAAARGTGEMAGTLGAAEALSRLPTFLNDPLLRSYQRGFQTGRDFARDVPETPFSLAENAEGIATTVGGSVESQMRRFETPLRTARETLEAQFSDYRFGTQTARLAGPRSVFSDLFGRGGGKLTRQQFNEEVTRVMLMGESHEIPQINAAAAAMRRYDDFLKQEAIAAGIPGFKEAVEAFEAAGIDPRHIFRVWNRQRIIADKPIFVDILTSHFIARQEDLRARIEGLEKRAGEKEVETGIFQQRLLTEVQSFAERRRALRETRAATTAEARAAGRELRKGEKARTAAERRAVLEEEKDAVAAERQINREESAYYKTLVKDLRRGRPVSQARDLIGFIRQEGGIRLFDRDALGEVKRAASRSSELQAIIEGVQRAQLIRKAGLDLDDILTRAIEQGYLEPGATLDDLVDAIADSLRGNLRYSALDAAEVAAQRDIEAILAELDQAGFDVSKMTVADLMEFFGAKTGGGVTLAAKAGEPIEIVRRETRGEGTQYHGAPRAVDIASDHYTTLNYYGQGFYTSDALDIVTGYSKRGGSKKGVIYRVSELAEVPKLDMEAPIPRWLVEPDLKGTGSVSSFVADTFEGMPPNANLREFYDEIRAMSAGEDISADSVQEIFEGFQELMRAHGFGAMTHVGGLNTGKTPHKVVVYFDPATQITIEPARLVDASAAARATPEGGASARTPAVQKIAAQIEDMAERFDEATLKVDDLAASIRAADEFAPEVAAVAKGLRVAIREAQVEMNRLRQVVSKLRSQSELSPAEIRSAADQTVDTILGFSPQRTMLPHDIAAAPRGPLKQRLLQIPTSLVWDFIERNPVTLARLSEHAVAADVSLMKKIGRLDASDYIAKLNDETAAMMRTATTPAERTAIAARQKQQAIDMQGIIDRLRGTYMIPNEPEGFLARAVKVIKNLNFLRLLGGMVISSFSDPGKIVFIHGLTRTFKTAFNPLVHGLRATRLSAREARLVDATIDLLRDPRMMALGDIMDDYGRASKFERGLHAATGFFGVGTLMTPWNAVLKQFVGIIVQTRMLQAIERLMIGKASKKEIDYLAAGNIDAAIAERIAAMFQTHGEKNGAVWWGNTEGWADRQAVEAYRVFISRDINRTIVTPGQDKPFWMSTQLGGVVGQFKSFAVASMQRTLLSGLQQRDMATLNGTLLMLALGSLSYWTKAQIAGFEVSDNPAKWATEALDYSGLLGWLMEANNIAENATGGTVGLSALTGETASRYASRNQFGALLGPTFDLGGDVFQSLRAISTGEWTASDIHALRKIMPLQNLFYIRQLFDAAERGMANAFGIPARLN